MRLALIGLLFAFVAVLITLIAVAGGYLVTAAGGDGPGQAQLWRVASCGLGALAVLQAAMVVLLVLAHIGHSSRSAADGAAQDSPAPRGGSLD